MSGFSFRRLGIFGFFFRTKPAVRRATRFSFRNLGIARRSNRDRVDRATELQQISHAGRLTPNRSSDHRFASASRGRDTSSTSRWSWVKRRSRHRGTSCLGIEPMEQKKVLASLTGVEFNNSPAGTYGIDQTISLQATFDEPVNVTGTPSINLIVGTQTLPATYESGDGTTKLLFNYKVSSGNLDVDGIAVVGPIQLPGTATIKAVSDGTAATSPLAFTAPSGGGINIDGVKPSILAITPPANRTYRTGEDLTFTVVYPESVSVGGTPRIKITVGPTVGAVDQYASYDAVNSNPSSGSLTFSYQVQDVDVDPDGIVVPAGVVDLNGGSIRDSGLNGANLTFTIPGTAGVLVNVASITGVAANADKTYKKDDVIAITVTFAQPVTVTGTPTIGIVVGTSSKTASYVGSTGTPATNLVFNYTVVSTDLDTNGIVVSSPIQLTGGATIKDGAGNNALRGFASPITTGVLVDGIPPAKPGFALKTDTGSSATDGITNDGTVNVTNLEANATWEYRTNGGASWNPGTGTSFTLGAGTYASGAIQVRQIDLAGNTGADQSNTSEIKVITTAPTTPVLALASDTGSSNSDGITSDGRIDVTSVTVGNSWEYRTSSTGTWINGSGSFFTLSAGTYNSGPGRADPGAHERHRVEQLRRHHQRRSCHRLGCRRWQHLGVQDQQRIVDGGNGKQHVHAPRRHLLRRRRRSGAPEGRRGQHEQRQRQCDPVGGRQFRSLHPHLRTGQ
jgi:hypothetical protein